MVCQHQGQFIILPKNPKGIHMKCNNVSTIPIIHPFRTIFGESGWPSSFSTNHIIALPIIPKKMGARYQAADGLSDMIDSQYTKN